MRLTYKNFLLFGLISSSLIFGACSSKKVSKSTPGEAPGAAAGDQTGTETGSNNTLEDETDPVNSNDKVAVLSASVGLLNFRQVAATYQSLTGVTLSNAAVLAEYNKQITSLPNDAAPAAISASKVSAATKLAAQYCDILATTPALLAARMPNFTVTAVPTDSTAYAKTLLNGFYGAEHLLQGPRATDISSVAATVDALKGMTGATGPGVFMATCAGLLASAEFFLY